MQNLNIMDASSFKELDNNKKKTIWKLSYHYTNTQYIKENTKYPTNSTETAKKALKSP